MGKSAAERQRERRAKLKEKGDYEAYKRKSTEDKREARIKKSLTLTEQQKNAHKEKDKIYHRQYRLRQKVQSELTNNISPRKAFGNRQALGKALSRVKKNLPRSPRKRSAVVQRLALKYSPPVRKATEQQRTNAISDEVKQLVDDFYKKDGISSQAPGMRDFCIVRNTDGSKTKLQKRFLQMTLGEAYELFKNDFPNHKIGLTRFTEYRPTHVCLRHETPSNMCLCIYHENVTLLLSSLPVFPNTTTEFVQMVVCSTESKDCMLQTCGTCKDLAMFKQLVMGFSEDLLGSEVQYKQWAKTEENRLVRSSVRGILTEALELLQEQLTYFLWHIFVKRAQAKYFENLKLTLPEGTLVIQADFSENYLHVYQDEVQSAYWENTSSTVYTTMIYFTEAVAESSTSATSDAFEVKSEPYVVISDYLHHDKYAVVVFNDLILNAFKQNHPDTTVRKIEYQSDGTSQHFKQKYTIYSMTLNTVPSVWNFSATAHGKGCIDGIGGTIKRRVREASRARNADPRTSLEFAESARKQCPNIVILHVAASFVERSKVDLDEMWKVDEKHEIFGMPGTRKAHCFKACGPGVVFYSLTSGISDGVKFNLKTGERQNISVLEADMSLEAVTGTPELVLQCGQWVKVIYDEVTFLGVIIDLTEDKSEYRVKCLKSATIVGLYKFEEENCSVWYTKDKIIQIEDAPTLMNARGYYKV